MDANTGTKAIDGRVRPALGRPGRRVRRLGERRLRPKEAGPPADPAKINRAVVFINERASTIRNEILAIGEYLLREFFDGDPKAGASRNPEKMNSFRDLASRKDLLLSYVTLWRAVQLAVQEKGLGTVTTLKQLSPSHKMHLLLVDDLKQKRSLAARAAEDGWSTRRLRQEIDKQRPKKERSHRHAGKQLPAAERDLDRATRAVTQGPIAPEGLDDLSRADLERITGKLQTAIGAIGRSLTVGVRLLAELRAGETKGAAV